MIHASICTIGNEILIGQVVDTNSSRIAAALEEAGIRVTRMVSFGDDRDEILNNLRNELTQSDIVITTGGLGPTKDDMTKSVLAELSGSTGYVEHAGQLAIIHDILHSRGLDMLEINRAQALVPDRCEVIENRLGTAPVMVFRFPADSFNATLYALPGVPFEAVGAIPDIMQDIRAHYPLANILHRSLMVYGLAESALSELIAPWEDALPDEMHLAYLPHPLTGIRLRLSIYGGTREDQEARVEEQIVRLKEILDNRVYSDQDDTLEATVGRLLKKAGMTLSAAESCTGGEISHLITSVPGSSAYYLGSGRNHRKVRCRERRSGGGHGGRSPEGDRQRLCHFDDRSGRTGRRCSQSGGDSLDRSRRTKRCKNGKTALPERSEKEHPAFFRRSAQYFEASDSGRFITLINR